MDALRASVEKSKAKALAAKSTDKKMPALPLFRLPKQSPGGAWEMPHKIRHN
jgi:hypothetical protein